MFDHERLDGRKAMTLVHRHSGQAQREPESSLLLR